MKWVYLFEEGNKDMRDLLGGKGAGVAEMTRAGLPVPPGFTITTACCNAYYRDDAFPEGMWEQALAALAEIEARTGKRFGDPANPLLVSVRSGAKFSMPGMMDTILNLGINAEVAAGLARLTGDERFALDAHRRFIQMFGRTAKGIGTRQAETAAATGAMADEGAAPDENPFESALDARKRAAGVENDADLTVEDLAKLVEDYRQVYRDALGEDFPEDPRAQLEEAIRAVFRSWMNPRAIAYRKSERIPDDLGTAVNVQSMVFGNMGQDSGTGVAFTRDPITGERKLYGDYLLGAQGEDVVAGIRRTERIDALERDMPRVYAQFEEIAARLEKHYRDVQDLEFTIERGKLWMLQTRAAKRTAEAAINIAVDMVGEGLIEASEAVLRVEPRQVETLLHRRLDPDAEVVEIGRGVPASPGAATGAAVFDADTAEVRGRAGEAVILVRVATDPDDVHGMIAAQGVLTSSGGTASHAALVARMMGKPCVVGADEVEVDLRLRHFTAGGVTVSEGEVFTIDGTTGRILRGAVPTIEPEPSERFLKLLGWADAARRLRVWANADYPRDALKARENGAEGIGLCRTEHMFMEQERLPIVQEMILAPEGDERRRLTFELLPFQRSDFEGILEAMDGLPVVIRLIDPPLHEFLPSYEETLVEVTRLEAGLAAGEATSSGPARPGGEAIPGGADLAAQLAAKRELLAAIGGMREANPMLGLRGCRLGITRPEITEMQVTAIVEAAIAIKRRGGDPHPEIMVPLVGTVAEIRVVRTQLEAVARQVMERAGVEVDYKFGTMIEVPRGALVAGEIAEHTEFFSFGTNDLTQTVFGYSRDDAEGKFLVHYLESGILPDNPFQTIDREGVGRLMRMAVEEGRKARPGLKIGICGEHGGDPRSVEFCHQLGLDYVSCSPFRIPVARLAAAQAAIQEAAASAERDR
ncbi:MAG TPA: pyruvate, phosphate dikinase [Candidatus Dormibacteraeota bacterium]|jgi:pyruvate,orthophosphate dikinase|nr:pyruvate, phosphate dikinase [Candidatus Dormibacteraeota bacterium]